MQISRILSALILALLMLLLTACAGNTSVSPDEQASAEASTEEPSKQKESEETTNRNSYTSGRIPEVLEEIPAAYYDPSDHPGTLEKLTYETWESFTYEEHSQALTKEAWVYLPYGYTEDRQYNIFYLSHGGWSNETTIMGTAESPAEFKHIIDHSIEDGKMQPMILVMVTYNNTSGQDSSDYGLALKLTDQFHNELVNDIIPAVESKYSTFAKNTTPEGLIESRDHRGFGGFSMGSVNTWCTFRYALPYFRYFMPMSGSYSTDGGYMPSMVTNQGYTADDFFIYSMSGPDDFAYSGIKSQIESMAKGAMFTYGDTEAEGNLAWREMDGYSHGREASNLYTYNGLQFFWNGEAAGNDKAQLPNVTYTGDSRISEVIADPVFEDYGRLLFPANTGYYRGDRMNNLSLTWYGALDTEKTVEIVNTLRSRADSGEQIFFDIYTEDEIAADPSKADTGLFFFKGDPGARFAICNAGGGMVFVGAMQDSFPHALELSKMGYNAFALIYRPGWETAMEDLGRAISFLYDHSDELEIDMDGYSLWGGSAGARMAATLGNAEGLAFYTGRKDIPQAAAVIMQYTGHSETSGNDAPTYACVGTSDGIANWRTMQSRLNTLTSNYGTPTEFHAYEGLGHGFGLGTGTAAEGWIYDAVAFWERQTE